MSYDPTKCEADVSSNVWSTVPKQCSRAWVVEKGRRRFCKQHARSAWPCTVPRPLPKRVVTIKARVTLKVIVEEGSEKWQKRIRDAIAVVSKKARITFEEEISPEVANKEEVDAAERGG